MWSYNSGHIITEEAQALIAALNDSLGNDKVHFYSGVSYRHICKIKGHEDTLLASCTPPHDIPDKPIKEFIPCGLGSDLLRELMPNSQRTKSYDVKLILPDGVKRLVHSNKPYDDTAAEGSRTAILWQKKDIYPTELLVAWTILDVDIAVVKKATPSKLTAPGEIVEVEVTIQNKGDEEVRDITLSDNFFPNAFEAVAPMDEFELAQPEMSDPHLYWKKEIESLKPGETKSYTYLVRVKTLGLETRLDHLAVLVNGIPVSVSNDVILYSELEEKYKPETPGPEKTKGFPTQFLVIGAITAIIAVLAVAYLIKRSKKE